MNTHTRSSAVRGFAAVIVVYVLGAAAAGLAGYKFMKWDPLGDARIKSEAQKLAETSKRFDDAMAQLDAARAEVKQRQEEIDATTKQQTQTGQTWVAATGQSLAAAPDDIKSEVHVAAAIKANAVAATALEDAVGKMSGEQIAAVLQFVANATSASETRRAQADAQLQVAQQQLAEMRQQKEAETKAKDAAIEKQKVAEQAYARTKQANDSIMGKLRSALSDNTGVDGVLGRLFFWLKLGLLLYVLTAYVLPLLANMFPGLKPAADLAHAVLAPLTAKAKAEAENLARDASAATHVAMTQIEEKAPSILAESKAKVNEWITEADGTKARFDNKLREAQLL